MLGHSKRKLQGRSLSNDIFIYRTTTFRKTKQREQLRWPKGRELSTQVLTLG